MNLRRKNRIEKEKKKTGLRRRRRKTGLRLRRHKGDTKTQGHKDTGGPQRHRRDTKTHEGEITNRHFKRIKGELTDLLNGLYKRRSLGRRYSKH